MHICKHGSATEAEAKAWEDDFIATQGCTMEMTFEELFEVYRENMLPRLR